MAVLKLVPDSTSHLPGYAVEEFTQPASGEPGFKPGQSGCRIHVLNHVTGRASTMPEQAKKAMALPSGWNPEGPAADLKPQSYPW